jgi:tetratricopeptide (TPR) repeat protein
MHALNSGPQCASARSGRQNRRRRFRRRARGLARAALLAWSFVASSSIAHAQAGLPSRSGSNAASLKQHYDSAHNFQSMGDMAQAAGEYKAFLAEALSTLGESHAAAGEAAAAIPLFEEALKIAPDDLNLRIQYAEACRRGNDLPRAKTVAEAAVAAQPKSAKARVELGQVLLAMKENGAAVGQLEEAVAIQPDFNNGYILATAYLHKKDEEHAAKIFLEMLAGFGDSAELHMKFGSAYAEAGYPEQAIQEFKRVIASNGQLPGAHYSLGAAYLVGLGEAAYSEAVPEFRKEVEINPNDFYSHFQLGFIALVEHRYDEADTELARASQLDPQNPDSFLSLGQLYSETNRRADAETMLRKAIALTTDESRNHYQVQRAHYLLARLLLQAGRQDEGKQQMELSSALMQKSVLENQGKANGLSNSEEAGAIRWQPAGNAGAIAEARTEIESRDARLRPAIAESFDNLGAIAAGANRFDEALDYFQQASLWNPELEGLDYNWGRAAYSAGRFEQAIGPLGWYLQAHQDDTWVRSALAMSYYSLERYDDALRVFTPMILLVDADPKAALAYAVCLVKTGNDALGMARLRDLARDAVQDAAPHEALGDALEARGDHAGAAVEFHAALAIEPSSEDAKFGLANALLALKQPAEARRLLAELVTSHSQNPGVYSALGKMQLERGETKAAIATLAAGAKIAPESAEIHRELAAAYTKDLRKADAAREMKLYEALQAKQPGVGGPANPN